MTKGKRSTWLACLTFGLVLFVLQTTQALESGVYQATSESGSAVTREVLRAGHPINAPGEVLELVRYTIAPGTQLPTHTHPGMQVAYVESGELTYTVVVGNVEVQRTATAGTPGPVDVVKSGEATVIHTGDSFVEVQGLVHNGRSTGTEPLVILVASLLTSDQPPSTVWTPPATPET